jgi:hypothetical protein
MTIDPYRPPANRAPPPEFETSAMTTPTAAKPRASRAGTAKSAARPKGRSKAEQRAESLEQMLDAAEELFSRHGLYGVTLKDVAQKVGVHTSLMHYYFDHPTVEGALRAFLDTDLDLYIEGGEGWRNYGALGGQLNNTPAWGAAVMWENFDPVVLQLIALLKKAMPDAAEEDIFWGYHFVTGALTLSLARTGRIDHLSGGLCKSDDFEAIKARMAKFMAGGFIAICEERAAERKTSENG